VTKKVTFPTKPQPAPAAPTADQWVAQASADSGANHSEAGENGAAENDASAPEPVKRLTLDIPVSLHTRIKSQCALRQVKMVEEIRQVLEEHFAEK
jgi:hypothetical protein